MAHLSRIVMDPSVMGGRPCIRGTRVTVSTIVGLVAAGKDATAIIGLYPYLTADDVREALQWAAWRAQEKEIDLTVT